MGGVVDYSTTSLGQPIGPLLKGPIDAVSAEIERQQEDEEKRKLLQMQLDQRDRSVARLEQADQNKNAYYQRKLDLADKREQGKLVMENQKRAAAAENDIRKAVGNGDIPLAESIGARFQQMDPATGDVHTGLEGFAVQPHGGQDEPAPPDAMTAAMSNPVTRLAGITDQDINQARGPEAPPQDFQAQHDAWQGAPDIIALHGQPLDREVIRHSASRAAGEDFAQVGAELQAQLAVAQQSGDQAAAAQIQRRLQLHGQLQPLVENGQIAPEKAAQTLMAGDTDLRARDIQAERDATSLANAQTNAGARVEAARMGNGRWEATNQRNDDKEERQKRVALKGELGQFWKQFGNGDLGTTVRGLQDLQTAVENGTTNSADAARAIGKWVQLAQGDKRISNQDIPVFFGRIGGIEKYGNDPLAVIDAAASGKLPPEIQGQIIEAGRRMLAQQRANVDEFIKAGDDQFAGFYGKHWDDFKRGLQHMGTPQSSRGGPVRDPSNPDDPNAPDAGRPLDGDVGEDRTGGIDRDTLLQEARRRGLVP